MNQKNDVNSGGNNQNKKQQNKSDNERNGIIAKKIGSIVKKKNLFPKNIIK